MKIIVIILFTVIHVESLDLYLPLENVESENYEISVSYVMMTHVNEPDECIHKLVYYESKMEENIKKVYYHGVEIFRDDEDDEEIFNRIVGTSIMSHRYTISVIKLKGNEIIFEKHMVLGYDELYDLENEEGRIEMIENGTDETLIGRIMRSIFSRSEQKDKNDYGELDEVDDEAILYERKEEINKQPINLDVREIGGNLRNLYYDQDQAGPSGMQKNFNQKNVKWRENNEESEEESD